VSNIRNFPNRGLIEQEAADWLIKLDREQRLSKTEQADFHEWVNRSAIHREEISSLASFWQNNDLTELAIPLNAEGDKNRRSIFSLTSNFNPALAACFMLVVITFMLQLPTGTNSTNTNKNFYSTAVGQQLNARLSDGSVIHLNTNSQIKVEFAENFRNILLLQGEAHFTVAKNDKLPFRVYAGRGRIEALGTAFSVYLQDQEAHVTVTEGRVEIAATQILINPADISTKEIDQLTTSLGKLDAGQSVNIRLPKQKSEPPMITLDTIEVIDKQELNLRLSWLYGLLTFRGDTLEDVVAEISRYTTTKIEIIDPDVRSIKIGGQFPAGETDQMFDILEAQFGLKVLRVSGNKVLLIANKN